MTTNTNYREQGRSVFLAAIMVLSVVAMSAAVAAPAAADNHEPDGTYVSFGSIDNDRFYQGQTVVIDSFSPNAELVFEHEDDERLRSANGSGDVEISISNYVTGDWAVYEEGSPGTVDNFTVQEQTLDTFAFDTDETEGTAALDIESNRRTYNISLSSAELSGQEINETFAANSSYTDDDVAVFAVDDGVFSLDGDFSDVDSGNYTIEGNVVDTDASASASIAVTDEGDTEVEFDGGPFSEEEGDIGQIDVTLTNTDTGYVNVTLEDYDYTATVDVSANDDGEATIDANTFLMGHSNAQDTYSGDQVDGFQEMGDLAQLSADNRFNEEFNFRLRTYSSDPTGNNDPSADDVSRLRLQDRSTEGLTTWVAPAGTISDADDIDTLTEDATQASSASVPDDASDGDDVIFQVEASGLYGYMNADAGNYNASGEHLAFTLDTEEETAFGTQERTENLDGALSAPATLMVDEENDQFFVAISSQDIAFDDYEGDFGAGNSFDVSFEVGDGNPYVAEEESESASASYSLEERTLEIAGSFSENDRLQVDGSSDASISADTTVAPNSEGTYFVETQDDIFQDSFTVSEDGTATASVDLSNANQGDILPAIEFEVDSDAQDSTEGVVGDTESASFVASGEAPGTVNVDEDVTLEATVENEGQAAGENSITVTVGGDEVYSNTTSLESGSSWSESFDVPTDSTGDVEWSIDAEQSSDSGTVSVEEEQPPEDDDGDDDMDGDEDGDDTNESDDDGDGDGQPGFGMVVALFALIGAALLALRRQN